MEMKNPFSYLLTLPLPNFLYLIAFIKLLVCITRIDAAKQDQSVTVKALADLPFARDDIYFECIEPEPIAYVYKIRPAKDFGIPLNYTMAEVELVPVLPADGCSTIQNTREVRGNVALVVRGQCSFMSKAINAERAGASAVVIADNDETNDGKYIDMVDDGTSRPVHLPSFFLLGKDGQMIRQYLDRLRLRSAVINIPINATFLSDLPRQPPPWTLW